MKGSQAYNPHRKHLLRLTTIVAWSGDVRMVDKLFPEGA
jgi:hypothetical protein